MTTSLYTTSPYTYNYFGAQLRLTTELTYSSLWLSCKPHNRFTANDASFYKKKFGLLLITYCSVFPMQWALYTCKYMYANIMLTSSTTIHVLLDKLSKYTGTGTLQQICCQAAKKKYKLGVKTFCKNEPQVGMGL